MSQVSYGTITITDTNDIESIIIEYARNQSTSDAPSSGWSTSRPAWAQGYYIWQRARIHKSGTETSADTFGTAVCITGSTGQTGTSVTISSIKYAVSTTESQPADSSFTYTSVPTVAEGSWLWTLTTYSNGSKVYTKSKQGISGDSITISKVEYQSGTSPTTAPTGTWQSSVPSVAEGNYLWTKTTYSDGNYTYSVAKQGVSGTSVSISSTSVKYQVSTSGTTTPTGEWKDTVQSTTVGQYLWTRTIVTYSNGSSTTSYSVAAHGANGTSVSISSIKYAVSNTDSQPADSSFTSTTVPSLSDGQWLWTLTTYSNGSKMYTKSKQGDDGRSLTNTVTKYTHVASGTTQSQVENLAENNWTDNVPTYNSSLPDYWVRITNTYDKAPLTERIYYKDNGITDSIAKANEAWNKADQAQSDASDALGAAQAATAATALLGGHFIYNSEWQTTNTPHSANVVQTVLKNGVDVTTDPTKWDYNVHIGANGIRLRNNESILSEWTSTALKFNNPSNGNAQLIIGANGTLQSGNYTRGSDSKFSSNGTKIDLINGDIITKYFRVSQGLESGLNAGVYVHGTIEALDGTIGTDSTNYWEIGNGTDYNLNSTAKMIGHGSSYIQLGDSSTWRLATNRIHTGWYTSNDSLLHFPTISSKYWDFGIHVPASGTDKFLYIRSSKANTSASNALQNLLYDIDDTYATAQWDYPFYIDGAGNVHAPAYYVGSEPLTGGVGSIAEKIINSDSTYGKGSTTQPIYIDSNGRPATTTYALNAAGAKGVDTSIAAASTSTNLPTSKAVAAFVEGKGYITSYTDNKVQTSQANTTKIFLAGTSTSGTSTGTLNYDSNVYLTTTAGILHATTFEGNLSGTATKANQDGDGNVIKTTYLKLSGGNVTGAVSFGSSVSADELTVGDLVVSGAASFTNNLQANTINGVSVGSSPKFTDTNYYHTSGSWGGTNSLTYTTTANGGAGTLAFTLATASTNAYGVTKLSDATDSTSTVLAATANAVKKAYDLAASKTSNTGTVTSVKVQGSNGLTGSGTITTSGTITISHADTSTQNSSSNSGRTYIQSITLDGYGHVTELSTATETVTNTHNTAYLYAGASNGTANAATTNGNTYLILMDGGSATTRRKISGSGTVGVTSDANGNITITGSAHPTALNGVSFADGVITFTKTDGSNTTIQTSNFVITQASGATALVGTDTNHTPLSVNGPVEFTNGVPVTMLPSTSTGLFLKDDGTWATPSASGSATNDSDGNPINTTYIKKSIGTAAGDIIYWSASGTPTRLAKGSNGQVLKMVNNVPAWSTDNNTWDALSTSQAGYVAKAPNDTAKFLRGDASWAVVTKSNVGLGSVDNTADADKRVKGANITTTANAVAYYTDTAGTFGSKASANGALYATSAGGALNWGTLPIAQGGTGKTTALAAITNLGGPYILAQGTEITASSNLDSGYKAMGTYYSPDSTRSNTLAGTCPFTGSGFKMITAIGYRGATIRQFAGGASNNLYYRSSQDTGSTWTKWYELVLLPSGSDNKTFAAIGGSTQPIYVNSSGVVTACTSYANATVDKANAANLTTTANAIAYYTDATGTFGSKASANGALYATSAGGALNWGTLPVAQGGTGATAARTAFHNLSAGLTEGTADPTDNTVFMCGNTNAATNDWYYRKMIHVWNYISGKISSSDAYVTTDTAQTLTTAATKTFLGLQTFGTNGIALGVTSGTSVTQKANMHYDSTLEAIVFSFA